MEYVVFLILWTYFVWTLSDCYAMHKFHKKWEKECFPAIMENSKLKMLLRMSGFDPDEIESPHKEG
jgi:hypothetical protein